MLLQVYSEISIVGRNPSKYEHEDVYRMPLLLATIYESARLLPTGPMLQRCSTKQGEIFLTLHCSKYNIDYYVHYSKCGNLTSCSLMFVPVLDLRFANGVTVPAGAVLVVPVQLVQKDDFNWGKDGSDFNPYRFLSNVTEGSGTNLVT